MALKQALPNHWAEIFMLACYMISTSDALIYCADSIWGTESSPVGSMSSQRISELLLFITDKHRNDFYRAWYAKIEENEYLLLDITSTSSYSELIEDVEWGYNRDHDPLPKINVCMLMDERSRLPIFQTVYSRSQKDAGPLIRKLDQFQAITRKRTITVVMDKGFYSTRNINHMLKDTGSGVENTIVINGKLHEGYNKRTGLG